MWRELRSFLVLMGLAACAAQLTAQEKYLPAKLDLTADATAPRLESGLHQPLPEQYIWAPSTTDSDSKRTFYFRRTFSLPAVPGVATLYAAGPDRIRVYVNGRLVANAERDPKSRLSPLVLSLNVTRALRRGANTLALEVSSGDRLAVKVVPCPPSVMGPALVTTGPEWKWSDRGPAGWQLPAHDDRAWKPVHVLGGIESDIEFLQWNSDAGMYRWPGYDGISPFLAHATAPAETMNYAFEGMGRLNLGKQLTVTLPPATASKEEYPYVVFDLGRECDGRLELVSDSAAPMKVEIQYGESLEEAVNEPYLGVDELDLPPHATAYGPKSAFRYALVRFTGGVSPLRFKDIRLDLIDYPVRYQGSFESSDPLLNRIWQVGAYTSHLAMQDDIWDAPKRDRGRWMGDLDVSGRVIDTVFADRFLMQDTMDRLVREAGQPVHQDVNTIPGYSAFWVMGQADYYRHLGDRSYLQSIRQPLTQLLDYMESELDDRHVFANARKSWPFVDWSPDLNEDTAEARRATHLEFARAFAEGAWLLGEAGDSAGAAKFDAEAAILKQAAQQYLQDPATRTFGSRWQTNAMAIFSGVADADETAAIWEKVLSQPRHFIITPYYNFYVIAAMAEAGHRRQALDWMREYWGGMIQEGATSFWEAYDPAWPKANYHASLQADNGQGYYVSLCHGWSSGPTAWLTEQVLGIQPQAAGFSQVSIRPDLAGLEWARGAEPTPHGPISVDLHQRENGLEATVGLPEGVNAQVSIPCTKGSTAVEVNGHLTPASPAEDGSRLVIHLDQAGAYKLKTEWSTGPARPPVAAPLNSIRAAARRRPGLRACEIVVDSGHSPCIVPCRK